MNANSTVLVVDDDKRIVEIISDALAGNGYNPVPALNGREALAYLRGSSPRPGLILLDLMMPEMNGWEFRKVQQDDPALADIPVAIITCVPDSEGKAAALGVVDVLYKPSRVESLLDLVSRFCGKK